MTRSRKTTLKERMAIVEDCIKNGKNCKETARTHKVSCQQVGDTKAGGILREEVPHPRGNRPD